MDFKDKITKLSEKIRTQVDSIQTEEATKNSFIMPMLVALGYDVFDPSEVVPELDCDIAKNKGDKIDYAVMRGGEPIILIECKHCKQNLELHNTQIKKYFVASKARFGVLTNGIEYRFYTDLDKTNLMDEKPFMVLNMLNLTEHDVEQLKKFHKSYFNESDILSTAQQLQISLSIRQIINRDFQNPQGEFVRYFVRDINGNSSAKLIDQYAPLVKKEIGSYINDVISERLNVAIKTGERQPDDKTEQLSELQNEAEPNNSIVTTQEELDTYNIVRSILRKEVNVSRITYKDYKTYFVICIDETPWKWICRLYLKKYKYISFYNIAEKSEVKFEIKSIDDIFNYSDRLVEALKYVMK